MGSDMAPGILLTEYKPAWTEEFNRERMKIEGVLAGKCLQIGHIGSTAIPGMTAKPIIDIAALVGSFDLVDEDARAALSSIGYEYVPKPEFPGRRFFRRGSRGAGTHHLHVYENGSVEWINQIAFRDYLRTHQEAHHEYAELKRRLSRETADRQVYTQAKEPFVRKILEKARLHKERHLPKKD